MENGEESLKSETEANTPFPDSGGDARGEGLLLSVIEKCPEVQVIDHLIGTAERNFTAIKSGIKQEGGLGLLEILLFNGSGSAFSDVLIIELAFQPG